MRIFRTKRTVLGKASTTNPHTHTPPTLHEDEDKLEILLAHMKSYI